MAFDLSTAKPVEEPVKSGFDLSTASPVEDTSYDSTEYDPSTGRKFDPSIPTPMAL